MFRLVAFVRVKLDSPLVPHFLQHLIQSETSSRQIFSWRGVSECVEPWAELCVMTYYPLSVLYIPDSRSLDLWGSSQDVKQSALRSQ